MIALAFCLISSCSKEPDRPPYVAGTPFNAKNPFPDASEVRMYIDDRYDADYNSTWTHWVKLSADQRRQFEATLSVGQPEWLAGCFDPHHFFRYYDSNGKQLGEIAVCFCCGGIELTPQSRLVIGKDDLLMVDLRKLEAFVTGLGEPVNVGCNN